MINFTFKTDSDYMQAHFTGHIPTYQMARVKVYHNDDSDGYVDFPVHSQEELDMLVERYESTERKFEAYQSEHFYDIQDYYEH